MARSNLRHLALAVGLLSLVYLSAPMAAQEAYIGQVGDRNAAANADFSGQGLLVSAQVGNDNTLVQINAQGRNTLAAVQIGNRNKNVSVVDGTGNFIGTAQFGVGQNMATSLVKGNRNQIATLQDGARNNSLVNLAGNGAGISVTQAGVGLSSRLSVQDGLNPQGAYADPLRVGVNQYTGDPAVNALVTRDSNGTITVHPGTATTILKLSS